MKKYLYIFKSEVMSNLGYVSNILFGFIGYAIHIFVFLNLWKYIYTNPDELINGYSFNQMVWYVILTEILWSALGGRKLCRKISDDVKGGNIAYNISKPYSYIGYVLSSHLGDVVIRGVIYTILGMILGFLFLGSFPSLNLVSVLFIILISIFAIVINTFMVIIIGLFSFIIEDSNPFWWLYSKFLLIVGTLFPIEFFPEVIRPILSYSPVYVVCYGPAKMFVNCNLNECFNILGMQVLYIIITYLICSLIYKKGVGKLNVNGG